MLSKDTLIAAGFALFQATRLHRLARHWTQGQGAILMFHHVRPWQQRDFAPNRLLEITPEFLDAILTRIKVLGFDILSLDQALAAIGEGQAKPFVCLTFDDAYKDFTQYALPVLERHEAPWALYVTTGYADRSARLWWVELEEAIRLLPSIDVDVGGARFQARMQSWQEKSDAFVALYTLLRRAREEELLRVVAALSAAAHIDPRQLVDDLCLDWDGIREAAHHPRATIGVHTLTHAMLAKHDIGLVRHELTESRRLLEEKLEREIKHLAYPVGDPTSAGPREFALARELRFASAVTTRPGMIFPEHAVYLTALPRLSINGLWQRLDLIDILLSGAPFALWNRGRHLSIA